MTDMINFIEGGSSNRAIQGLTATNLTSAMGRKDAETRVRKALHAFLNPLTGGPDGNGQLFGRYVYMSEIMQVIDSLSGVDHVVMATMCSMKEGSTVWKDEGGGPIMIESHELIYSKNEADHRIVAQEMMT